MTDQGPKPTESTPSAETTTTPNPVEPAAADPTPDTVNQGADLQADTERMAPTTDTSLANAELAVKQIQEQYRYSDEAREALLGSILRMVDEHRFGHRDLSTEEVRDLAEAWSALNDGLTGTEVGYNWTIRRLHARRSESRRHD